MSGFAIAPFLGIASALFLTELTDKDALLILGLATRTRAATVFLAGAVAFTFTTTVIVSLGAVAVTLLPIEWIKLAGGAVMIAYGMWEARGLIGEKAVASEEKRIEEAKSGLRAFLLMVGALALLDLAGDATEVLTIVFVAQYSDTLLVFTAAIVGLVAATAVETALGNRLGRMFTPRRLRYGSAALFIILGATILATTLL